MRRQRRHLASSSFKHGDERQCLVGDGAGDGAPTYVLAACAFITLVRKDERDGQIAELKDEVRKE